MTTPTPIIPDPQRPMRRAARIDWHLIFECTICTTPRIWGVLAQKNEADIETFRALLNCAQCKRNTIHVFESFRKSRSTVTEVYGDE